LPDANAYTRPEVGGLLFRLRGNSIVVHPQSLPDDLHELVIDHDVNG
jgi:4-methylaminobutanoate oxidase (formaldehyde-forming)